MDERECDGCGSTTAPLTEYRKAWPLRSEEMKPLCDLCAGTKVGQLNDYAHLRENPDLVEIQRQINYVGNVILTEIRKLTGGNQDTEGHAKSPSASAAK